jgi:toxin YhaV
VPLVVNGWTLLYHPVFGARYQALRNEARRLKSQLPPAAFVQHPVVKLVAAVRRLVLETVPADPNAAEFRLRAGLARFRRARGHGLPPRYRLFWVFSESARVVIFLYLNDQATLRQEGSRTDPYEVFKRLVARGDIGADFEANRGAWRRAHPDSPHRDADSPPEIAPG